MVAVWYGNVRIAGSGKQGMVYKPVTQKLSLMRSCSLERVSECHSLHSVVVSAVALLVKQTG